MRKSDCVFFLTGTAALVYETVWIRLLARLVGSDAVALAVVLAIFMGGMGLGAWLFARPARAALRPERLFALLEIGVGVWAALSPWLLPLFSPVEGFTGRALLGALFLLPPTLAMGATFPLMGRLTIRLASEAGSETSAFYGANTLGAATGAMLGPLLLMPLVGLSGALWIAAGVDFLAAALALRWFRGAPALELTAPERPAPLFDPVLLATLLMGCCGLALEVILVRLLVTVTGASVYAYAIVLGVFLAGIGLGSAQLVQRRTGTKRRLVADASTLSRCALFLPVFALLGLLALRWQLGETDLFGPLQNRMPSGAGIVRLWASHALFAALALLPPALALGAALPSAAAELLQRHPEISPESALSRVYAFNTAGALGGSLFAAFFLLPELGPRAGLALVLGLALLAGSIVPGRRGKEVLLAVVAVLLVGATHVTLVGGGSQQATVLYVGRDSLATVSVEEVRTSHDGLLRALRVNGKVVATSAPVDLRLQRFLGQVPALLHGDVKRAAVIGMGTGMTAGSLLDFPTLEELLVIEISPAVPIAASHFSSWNGALLFDERTQVRVADGRHAMALSEERWDLITSDPIHPWTRGSSDLYSLEHFTAMAKHLAPGGVASQWLPLYQLSEEDVKTVIATWCAAFPHTSAWLTAYDLALVGSEEPLPGERDLASLSIPQPVQARLAETAVHTPAELVALLVADDSALREYARGTEPMRDDRPVLEFRAPLSYLGGYSTPALRWAGRESFVETLPEASRERAREVREILARFLEALPGGTSAAAERYGVELFALPPL